MTTEQKAGEAIRFLSEWYHSQCNDEWEHGYGIDLSTIDNPGFSIDVDLTGTKLENVNYKETKIDYEDELNWISVFKKDNKLRGVCGPLMLSKMLIEVASALKSMQLRLR